jgi:PAS domain S-box-containing protein
LKEEKSKDKTTIKILHVDDEVNQLDFTKMFLEEIDEEVEVESYSNPEDALNKLSHDKDFDCIISDYKMLYINGIELAQKVREQSTIPFILYTGQGSEEVAEQAFEAGVDDYIRKESEPSHYQVLAKRIRHNVEKHEAEQLYRKVVDESRDGILIIKNTKILYVNTAMLNMYGGVSDEQLLSLDLKDLFLKKIEEIEFLLEKNSSTYLAAPSLFEMNYRTLNRGIRLVEVSSSKINFKGEDTFVLFLRDITERKLNK